MFFVVFKVIASKILIYTCQKVNYIWRNLKLIAWSLNNQWFQDFFFMLLFYRLPTCFLRSVYFIIHVEDNIIVINFLTCTVSKINNKQQYDFMKTNKPNIQIEYFFLTFGKNVFIVTIASLEF